MKKAPLVSVIIPAYHSDAYIGGCLDSLKRQTYPHIQVVIANSSQEGKTRQVIEKRYPEAHFIQNPRRLLPQDAKNLAAANADGDLLAFIDPDCRAHPDWLTVMVNQCEQGKNFVGGSLANHCHTWLESGIHLCKFHDVLSGIAAGPISIIPFSNACLKRSVWKTIGPFKPNLFCSDGLLSWRARDLGYTPWFEPSAVVEHIHGLTPMQFFSQRFFRGREFAVERMGHGKWSKPRTAAMVILSPLIILHVLSRSARNAVKSGKGLLFIKTIPIQIMGQSAWILGETLSFMRALMPEKRMPYK